MTLEFRKRADAEICLLLDDVKAFGDSGVKMRVYRPKRFIERWNALVEKGKNPMQDMLRGK